jgi:hypothetical protein
VKRSSWRLTPSSRSGALATVAGADFLVPGPVTGTGERRASFSSDERGCEGPPASVAVTDGFHTAWAGVAESGRDIQARRNVPVVGRLRPGKPESWLASGKSSQRRLGVRSTRQAAYRSVPA